jgi:hypothetical protein
MKLLASLLFTLLISTTTIAKGKKKSKSIIVQGTLTTTSNYCGGAVPTDDIVAELAIPKPKPNAVIYIGKQGAKRSTYKKVISNANGKFTIKLSAGTYCIIEEYKTKPFVPPINTKTVVYNTACLKQKYLQADYTFTISANNNMVNYNKHLVCKWQTPCTTFNGQLPPMAPPRTNN